MNNKKMNTGNKGYEANIIFGAKGGSIEQISLALSDDPDSINYQDSFGLSALHYAAARGFGDVVDYLLSQPGVSLNLRDKNGRDALDLAILSGSESVLSSLFRRRAQDLELIESPDSAELTDRTGRVVPLKPKRT